MSTDTHTDDHPAAADESADGAPPAAAQRDTVNVRLSRKTIEMIEHVRKILVSRAMSGFGPGVEMDIQVPTGAIVEMVFTQWIETIGERTKTPSHPKTPETPKPSRKAARR